VNTEKRKYRMTPWLWPTEQ